MTYIRDILAIVVLAGLYFLGAWFGLALTFIHPAVSSVWPATGIALAGLLLFGYRLAPGVFIGAFGANLLVGGALGVSLGIATGNTIEALVGAYLINRFANGQNAFKHAWDVMGFVVFAGLIAPMVGATIGVISLILGKVAVWSSFFTLWFTWWMGDAGGAVILAPLFILWIAGPPLRFANHFELLENSLIAVLLVAVSVLSFSDTRLALYPTMLAQLPLLVWIAMRFSPKRTITAVVIAIIIAVWGTLQGHGVFAEYLPTDLALPFMAAYLTIISMTMLVLAVVVSEHRGVREELHEANERKDRFLALLSHELRNPLAAITNYVEILRLSSGKKVYDEDQELAVKTIATELGHVRRMLDDLLDISRVAAEKITLQKEKTDLVEVVQQAISAVRPFIEERQHSFSVDLPEQPQWSDVDPVRIKQVVVNLLHNAAKYTDPGGSISLSCSRATPDEITIVVQDTGIGIDEERLPHIFDLYIQSEDALGRSQGGLGIGLALVKTIIEMHHGTVEAVSRGSGTGSIFTVRMPVEPEEVPHTNAIQENTENRSMATETFPILLPAPVTRLRILLVDDNKNITMGFRRLLQHAGYDVRTAHAGPEALSLLQQYPAEVVVLDLGLPGMDGYELAAEVQKNGNGERKPLLIAMSGYGQVEDKRRSKEAGFAAHLVKPVTIESLLTVLRAKRLHTR